MTELGMQTVLYGLSRYFHLSAAVIAIGGTFVLRYIVLPVLQNQPEDVQRAMHAGHRSRLWVMIPAAIAVLLVSGVINLIRAFTVAPAPPVAYHMVLGVKLLAALVLFVFALMMVWPGPSPNAVQRRRRFFLTLNSHLGLLIIALSVVLRFLSGK